MAVVGHAARIRPQQAVEQLEQSGLAATVDPQHDDALAGGDVQGQVAQEGARPKVKKNVIE